MWLHLHSVHRTRKRLLWICGYWVPKHLSHSVARWLRLYPSLPRMLHLYPASHSYFMSCPSTCQLLFWNVFLWCSPSELCLRHLDICNHLCLFSMSKFKILRRQRINYWGCIGSHHCECNKSSERNRCMCCCHLSAGFWLNAGSLQRECARRRTLDTYIWR